MQPLSLFKDGSCWSFTPVTGNGGGLFFVGLCVHARSVFAWPKFQMATDGNTK
jgi:hypothetical protein